MNEQKSIKINVSEVKRKKNRKNSIQTPTLTQKVEKRTQDSLQQHFYQSSQDINSSAQRKASILINATALIVEKAVRMYKPQTLTDLDCKSPYNQNLLNQQNQNPEDSNHLKTLKRSIKSQHTFNEKKLQRIQKLSDEGQFVKKNTKEDDKHLLNYKIEKLFKTELDEGEQVKQNVANKIQTFEILDNPDIFIHNKTIQGQHVLQSELNKIDRQIQNLNLKTKKAYKTEINNKNYTSLRQFTYQIQSDKWSRIHKQNKFNRLRSAQQLKTSNISERKSLTRASSQTQQQLLPYLTNKNSSVKQKEQQNQLSNKSRSLLSSPRHEISKFKMNRKNLQSPTQKLITSAANSPKLNILSNDSSRSNYEFRYQNFITPQAIKYKEKLNNLIK